MKARKASVCCPLLPSLPLSLTTISRATLCHYSTSKQPTHQGISYPNTYATAEQAAKDPAAYQLNCAQRAHANFTENLTPWMTLLLVAGLRFPVAAAGLGATWLASRVVYTVGYTSSKGPKGRQA